MRLHRRGAVTLIALTMCVADEYCNDQRCRVTCYAEYPTPGYCNPFGSFDRDPTIDRD